MKSEGGERTSSRNLASSSLQEDTHKMRVSWEKAQWVRDEKQARQCTGEMCVHVDVFFVHDSVHLVVHHLRRVRRVRVAQQNWMRARRTTHFDVPHANTIQTVREKLLQTKCSACSAF